MTKPKPKDPAMWDKLVDAMYAADQPTKPPRKPKSKKR